MVKFFITLLGLCSLNINNFYIHGRLVNHEYSPVEYFIVEMYESDGNRACGNLIKTDTIQHKNGEFVIKPVNSGKYLLKIDVPKYTGYLLYVEIKNNNYSFGDIFLQASR